MRLTIYNLSGEEMTTIVSDNLPQGHHQYNWNAGDFAAGIYICRLQTDSFVKTMKLVFVK